MGAAAVGSEARLTVDGQLTAHGATVETATGASKVFVAATAM